jgi:hypothetical protein
MDGVRSGDSFASGDRRDQRPVDDFLSGNLA